MTRAKVCSQGMTSNACTLQVQTQAACLMKAFMLSKMERPSRTAATIVLKLSSASTMSLASLATCKCVLTLCNELHQPIVPQTHSVRTTSDITYALSSAAAPEDTV